MSISVTYNSNTYEIQILNGVVQIKQNAGAYVNTSSTGIVSAYLGSPWIYAKDSMNVFTKTFIEPPFTSYYSTNEPTISDEYNAAVINGVQIPASSSVASSIVTTPITVSLVNGVVTSAIGVALSGVAIGPSNATHTQVTIDLGTNTNGKRRQPQGFRLLNGRERDLASTRSRNGEAYTFVFQGTVDGSNSVNLVLN